MSGKNQIHTYVDFEMIGYWLADRPTDRSLSATNFYLELCRRERKGRQTRSLARSFGGGHAPSFPRSVGRTLQPCNRKVHYRVCSMQLVIQLTDVICANFKLRHEGAISTSSVRSRTKP